MVDQLQGGATQWRMRPIFLILGGVAAGGILGIVLLSTVNGFLSFAPPTLILIVCFVMIAGAAMALPMFAFVSMMQGMSGKERQQALRHFAEENDFSYAPRPAALALDGTLFRRGLKLGSVELFYDILTARSGRRGRRRSRRTSSRSREECT